jgi:hypothetical protein
MAHLTIEHLEKAVADCTKPNCAGYVYAETGRYKPYTESTIRAAIRRGYRAEKKCQGVYYIYPKKG